MRKLTALPKSWTGPGLVDLQVNGYAGFDFNGPASSWTQEALAHVKQSLARHGTMVALPTLITDHPAAILARARSYAQLLKEEPALAKIFPRLHIEGPFVSPEEGPRGAHPQAYCRTPLDLPELLPELQQASGGRIGILTLAPELPGALDLISQAASQGICVAIGHTAASLEQIQEAIDAGARLSTHLGNGSHQVLPRLDNYVQFQLAEERLAASFIADGHHMPFSTLKNYLRAKTPQRSILVTDAIAAADVGPGRYTIGGEEIVVSTDLLVSKPGQWNLSGSALTLDRAIINVVIRCGFTWKQAWKMASNNPVRLLGLELPEMITVDVNPEGFRNHELG